MIIVAVLVGLGLVASLVAFMVESSTHHTIIGALDVGTLETNSQCLLAPEYQGIQKGTDVVVRDTDGTVIGRTKLGPGRGVGPFCEFLFAIRVPNRALYSISIGDRGQITYSRAYFNFFRWHAGLALRGAKLTWD
jgi:hypothetical protein